VSAAPAGPRFAAVGIPQGVVVDPEAGEEAGAVRRGGEVVSLDRVSYELWLLLLVPLPFAAIAASAASRGWGDLEPALARLARSQLSVALTQGEDELAAELATLRPIPLGMGIGNTAAAPDTFRLQSADHSRQGPVVLDSFGVTFWWECDGASSLDEIVDRLAGRRTDLPRAAFVQTVVALTAELMTGRLLYLDSMPERDGADR
jgi:hypothetical protein